MENERLSVICRPARESDTADMLEITKDMWDGQDYVPQMWAEWLADSTGCLLAAEYAGRVIGLGRLSRLSEQDWWLQGLRVHPDYQGRGVASQLHYALMDEWERIGSGTVRLLTFRPQVQHLCQQLGFTQVGEYSEFSAPVGGETSAAAALPFSHETPTLPFRPLMGDECAEAAAYAAQNPARALLGDLMDLSWERVPPRAQYLEPMAERGLAWWWRGRRGLLTTYEEKDDQTGQLHTYIGLLACPVESIVPLLLNYRRLAAALDYPQVEWSAPLHPDLLPHLETAGFIRTWDKSTYAYAKEKAGSSAEGRN